MKTKNYFISLTLACLLLVGMNVNAQLICYESFNYTLAATNPGPDALLNSGGGLPATNTSGTPTGTSTGFRNAWPAGLVVAGLSYGNNGYTLNCSSQALKHTSTGSDASPWVYRYMATDPFGEYRGTTANLLGWKTVNGASELYISALINVNQINLASAYSQFKISTGYASLYIMQYPDSKWYAADDKASTYLALGDAVVNKTDLIVVRLRFKSATELSTDFWFNPDLSVALGTPTATRDYITGVTDLNNGFQAIQLKGGGNVLTVDEIRVGKTAADVLPVSVDTSTGLKNLSTNFNAYQSANAIVVDLSKMAGKQTIDIFDAQGKNVLNRNVEGGKLVSFNNTLKQGIYLVTVSNTGNTNTLKLFIK